MMLKKILPLIWFLLLTVQVKSGVMNGMETIRQQKLNEISTANERRLILVHDDGSLKGLTKMIMQKMRFDVYDIDKEQVPNADGYDIILLADAAVDDHPSPSMKSFLGWYDLAGTTVSSYWIFDKDKEQYESELKDLLRNEVYVSGFGSDIEEVSQGMELNGSMNGWLTSVHGAVKNQR